MNNYLKKIGALLMAVIMIVTMCVTAFAADAETPTDQSSQPTVKTATGTESDSGVITVEGIKKESGITVYAYQIVKADYDEKNGNFTGESFSCANSSLISTDSTSPIRIFVSGGTATPAISAIVAAF